MRVCSSLSKSQLCTDEPQFRKGKDAEITVSQLYFTIDHDSRVASFLYTESVSPCVRLCRICQEFHHGVPSARKRTQGPALVSLKDLEKKECPPGKGKKQWLRRRMSLETTIQRSGSFGREGGPPYVKARERWKREGGALGCGQHHPMLLAMCICSFFGSFCSKSHSTDAVSGSSVCTQAQLDAT